MPSATRFRCVMTWVRILSSAYFKGVAAMIYHDLPTVKEGVGAEEIAAAFD